MKNQLFSIAAEIRAEAARQNMPYTHLAELSGLSASSISRKIGQEISPLYMGEAYALAQALDISFSELVARAEKRVISRQTEAA